MLKTKIIWDLQFSMDKPIYVKSALLHETLGISSMQGLPVFHDVPSKGLFAGGYDGQGDDNIILLTNIAGADDAIVRTPRTFVGR